MQATRLIYALASLVALAATPTQAADKDSIRHIIVISLENHSFDNLFGMFEGAEGLSKTTTPQTDRNGTPYKRLPPVIDTRRHPALPDARFFEHLPNAPFSIERYAGAGETTADPVHRFDEEQQQINGGRMDRFVAISDTGALTMGYYDGSKLAMWDYAKRFTLADHFFHAAFGGSFLNHIWLVCACTPRYDDAPKSVVAKGSVTADGFAVNTIMPRNNPHPKNIDSAQLLPPQTLPTIGERLSEKGISWAWYSGGWNDAAAGKPHPTFQFHHQPFVYFAAYGEESASRKERLKDETDFLAALKNNSLPAVAFYKPLGKFNMHPHYGNVESGDAKVASILKAIEDSPVWDSSVVIVTFDENGGFFDHVAPPEGDRFGPGTRVPTLIISPFAKKGFVDHTTYDTTSILALIEWRFGLQPLGTRDAKAANLTHALNLN